MSSTRPAGGLATPAVAAALVLLVFAIFWPVSGHDFINYDDNDYVTANPHVLDGLSTDGIAWALTTMHASNWHPLTWWSHQLDVELFGLDAGRHHLTNVGLHAANSLLLFLVLLAMTGARWRSAVVAALFAVHPLHVESVAWIAERKDVLSGLFWMATWGAYVRYSRQPTTTRYLPVVILFALGLMAKPMLVTLPLVFLLIDFWPLKRVSLPLRPRELQRLFLEKLPLLLLSGLSSYLTYLAQSRGGSVKSLESLALSSRVANAFVAWVAYVGKMLWPADLAVLYPHQGDRLSTATVVLAVVALLAVTIFCFSRATRQRYLPVGWLWYLGTLVPVIGIVQVGAQAIADRYTYLPSIGLFIAVVWGLHELAGASDRRRGILALVGCLVVAALALTARAQVRHWRDSLTLFSHTIEAEPESFVAFNNLGETLNQLGRVNEAEERFRQAVDLKPSYRLALYNLGLALAARGAHAEATSRFEEAVRLDPLFAAAHNDLGLSLTAQGQRLEGLEHHQEAVRLNPEHGGFRVNLGIALAGLNRPDEAIEQFVNAARVAPQDPAGPYSLGILLQRQQRPVEAVEAYRQAVMRSPTHFEARASLAILLVDLGELEEGLTHLAGAATLRPDNELVLMRLAQARQQQGDLAGAANAYRQLLRYHPDSRAAQAALAEISGR